MTADQCWLEAAWPFVRDQMPPAPARVLEIGCGPIGGFVPMLIEAGHTAVGIDPRAPASPNYRQVTFEQYESLHQVDAVVASTSLHHVTDLGQVLEKVASLLVPGGAVVVVEWAWERVDQATAQWCFDRLDTNAEPSWLSRRRDEWQDSGLSWDTYFTDWAAGEGLHSSDAIRGELDKRFHCLLSTDGPYYFPELDDTTEAEEQAAVDAGVIRASATRYAGQLRSPAASASAAGGVQPTSW